VEEQNPDPYSKEDLLKYRIKRARESLEEAHLLADAQHYNASINRLYYGCYYIVTSLLLKHNIYSSTHSGVRNQFGLHFVKTHFVSKENATTFSFLFDQRHKSDYDDFVVFTKSEVSDLNNRANLFIKQIEQLINS